VPVMGRHMFAIPLVQNLPLPTGGSVCGNFIGIWSDGLHHACLRIENGYIDNLEVRCAADLSEYSFVIAIRKRFVGFY